MDSHQPALNISRLGYHYYPDTYHFQEKDLNQWLPELTSLGAAWVTLVAPAERAIPEWFLSSLLAARIEPILSFHLPLEIQAHLPDLALLFRQYARWGIRYAVLFDRPNLRLSWPPTAWSQSDLVERFLDLFLPLAETALQAGLTPVFPPLEPGGDYWDTAFLRGSLRGMQRRGQTRLLETLVLGAYAWASNRSLHWGAGGPECWPAARPYVTPPGSEDQRGFRIFEWYSALSQAELGKACPILLLAAGCRPGDQDDRSQPAIDLLTHATRNLDIARLVSGEQLQYDVASSAGDENLFIEPVPNNLLACNFWLLNASASSPYASQAWFQPDGRTLPAVNAIRQWLTGRQGALGKSTADGATRFHTHPIAHYLLLPLYAWGAGDWDLDNVRPFIQKHHPTVGFSLAEARLAERVTLAGGEQSFSPADLDTLRQAGCSVERLHPSGTSIAP